MLSSLSSKFSGQFMLFAALCFIFQACAKDEEVDLLDTLQPSKGFNNVDAALWPYFEKFETEARLRAYDIDLNQANLRGIIQEIEQDHVAGQCNYHPTESNLIIIDKTFWQQSSELQKEFVVFHEIGHCFLGRAHRETSYTDGTCVSLMRSGLGTCQDNYNSLTRNRYIDELFDPESI